MYTILAKDLLVLLTFIYGRCNFTSNSNISDSMRA